MKKFVSLLLTVCMLLTGVLAAPAGLGVEAAAEVVALEKNQENDAVLASDGEKKGVEALFYGFDGNVPVINGGFSSLAVENGVLKGSCVETAAGNNYSDPNFAYSGLNVQKGQYKEVRIRMRHNETQGFQMNFFYGLKKVDGTMDWYSKYETLNVSNGSTNGEFVTYTIPLTDSKIGDSTLTQFRFDPTNKPATDIEIDYIMFVPATNADKLKASQWTFEKDGDFLGWGSNIPANSTVSGGALNFTPNATYSDINFGKNISFNADDYCAVEVIMDYDFTASSSDSTYAQIYFSGTALDGTEVALSEANSKKTFLDTKKSNGYVSVVIDVDSVASWSGSTISYIRLDPINTLGSFSVKSIRLVPAKEKIWGFDNAGDFDGWALDTSSYTVSGNALNFKATDTYKDPQIYMHNLNVKGKDYSSLEVKMKHDMTASGNTSTHLQVYYTGKTSSGQVMELSETYAAKTNVNTVSSDGYVTYTIDLEKATGWHGGEISSIRVDPINALGDFSIDTIRLVPAYEKDYVWDFDANAGGWSLVPSTKYSYKNSSLCYTSDVYDNARLEMGGLNIDANKVSGLEIVLKHTNASSASMRFYFTGTDVNGSALELGETNATGITLPVSSGEDCYNYYKIDFANCQTWKNSTIKTIRLDVIKNVVGSFEIEYLRLITLPAVDEKPLDASLMSLNYAFDEQTGASANGTITLGFGEQNPADAKYVRLNWATGNETDGYTDLADYTAFASLEGAAFAEGYKVTRGVLIPDGATAITAHVKDCEKEFTLHFDVPASKQWSVGEPIYRAAYTSDYHFGGHGSTTTSAAQKHYTVKEELHELADYVAVVGDITQWYGEMAKDGEWKVAKDYFDGFTIPVYVTNGNHDVPDSTTARPETTHSPQYYRDFLEDRIAFAKQNGHYDVTLPSDTENYYHTYANGHHLIFLSNPRLYAYSFGDEQLAWLDKVLYENEESGEPIFVFGHIPSKNTVGDTTNWSANQIGDNEKFTEILNRHPNAVYITGHTHLNFDNAFPNAIDGKGTSPSYVNDGGIANLNYVKGGEWFEIDGSIGVIAHVYEDKIILRGRDFINSKWIAGGLYQITLANSYNLETPTASKSVAADGSITLSVANNVESVEYTWHAEGQTPVSGDSITLASGFGGYVALRATATDGTYVSKLYNSVFEISDVMAPVTKDGVEMRINTPSGIRFKATVTDAQRGEFDGNVEYGFIVARADKLKSNGIANHELTFDIEESLYTYGVSYYREKGSNASTDIIFDADYANSIYTFTGVMTGIPAKYSDFALVARPYFKQNAGTANEVIYYGEPMEESIYNVAAAIKGGKDYTDSYTDEQRAFIDSMVAKQ